VAVDHCEDCPFVYADHAVADLPGLLRAGAGAVAATVSATPLRGLRARPIEGTWSALEYACHVRDVLEVQHGRLGLALVEDRPVCEPMGRDERPAALRYNEQPPAEVAADIEANGESFAAAFEALDDAGRARLLVYTWPVESERDLLWVTRHTLHELVHHHRDIRRVLAA
jgi:S-DNA-T family DNA segregation ATPase FtsK/SpoIIIE